MINIIQDISAGYPHRTYQNVALSDITLAFAVDFSSAGEKLTKIACSKLNKPIFQFKINERGRLGEKENDKLEELYKTLKEKNLTKINIAGNGIYHFAKYRISQERVNELITNVLIYLIERGCNIEEIRSGGQTGADEAGLIAGLTLGIKKVTCLCPKGYRFRDIKGNEVYSKERFFKRFI